MKRGLVFCVVALVAWLLHAACVDLVFGHDVVALLLSPGAHSSLLGLVVAVVFVLSRLVALVVAPALVLAGAAEILLSCVTRRRD